MQVVGQRREIRQQVQELAGSPELGVVVEEMLGDLDKAPQEKLKTAEYALLVGPIATGLTTYLDEFQEDESDADLKDWHLNERIGIPIRDRVLAALDDDPNLDLLKSIRSRRQEIDAPLDVYGIWPYLPATIDTASRSSVRTMLAAARANRSAVLQKSEGAELPRDELVGTVRRSVQLPLSLPLVNITRTGHATRGVEDLVANSPHSRNSQMLVYNTDKGRVVMASVLGDWRERVIDIKTKELRRIADIPEYEPTVGCPITFDPKLVIRYYQHIVDLTALSGILDDDSYRHSRPEVHSF